MKNEIVVATQIKDTYKFVELSINKAFGEIKRGGFRRFRKIKNKRGEIKG